MRVSDLQMKDVISLFDGRRLGRITDIELEPEGVIKYFVVEPKRFFRFFSAKEELSVSMKQIKKIGEDVILVEI